MDKKMSDRTYTKGTTSIAKTTHDIIINVP